MLPWTGGVVQNFTSVHRLYHPLLHRSHIWHGIPGSMATLSPARCSQNVKISTRSSRMRNDRGSGASRVQGIWQTHPHGKTLLSTLPPLSISPPPLYHTLSIPHTPLYTTHPLPVGQNERITSFYRFLLTKCNVHATQRYLFEFQHTNMYVFAVQKWKKPYQSWWFCQHWDF